MAHNKHHVQTEKIVLQKLSMRSRKAVGMLAQRHLDGPNPGTITSLRTLLQDYIDTHEDVCAARWLLARIKADPLAEINCRRYICELLYGYR